MVQPLTCVVSVSGIRGIIGHDLSCAQILALASAYGQALAGGGTVVLGRDSRPTGDLLAQAVAAGLRAVGCSVVDLGIVPTPTVPMMISALGAAGGIQISASHNPVAWNALKCFSAAGRSIDGPQLERLLAAYAAGVPEVGWQRVGAYRRDDQALERHRQRVLAAVDGERIRAARLRVVIDSVNGAGSIIAPRLLQDLGCEVIPVFASPDLPFPRDPEPTAANVTLTGAMVRAVHADLGLVQDPDADRLAVIDEQGTYIGEEYTLVLAAASRLAAASDGEASPRVVCTNLSTSRMLDDVAARCGATVVRTAVGEAHVVDAMQRHGAILGGEGNGGVIDPRVVLGRDSQVAMALIADWRARRGQPLSVLVGEWPRYAMHKEKLPLSRAQLAALRPRLRDASFARGAQLDELDGLTWRWPDRWVQLRASGTEPVSRLISEAPDAAAAHDLADQVRAVLGVAAQVGHA
jgi:phosphomannomutase